MARTAQRLINLGPETANWPQALAAALLILGLAACDTAREAVVPAPDAASAADADRACWSCHGTPGNPAPPRALKRKGDTANRTATTDPGVGAHAAHLGSKMTTNVQCQSCHVVPSAVFVPGHMDGADKAALTFGGVALAGGATPSYDASNGTCASSYCHGGTLKSGAGLPAPKWTQVDGKFSACGSCHGAPPAAPHPKGDDCGQCHAATVAVGQKITFTAKHIDGKVDVVLASSTDCAACHGNPPPGPKHPPGQACNQCHASSIGANKLPIPGGAHRDGTVQVVLADNASCSGCHGDPPVSAKHPNNNQCSQCHAVTVDAAKKVLASGKHMDGQVQVVLAKDVNCGSCHGNPPPAPKHPINKNCSQCHADSIGADLQPLVGGKHMDGKVQISFSKDVDCASCHGDPPAVVASGAKHPISTKCSDCHAESVGADKMPLAGGKHMDGKVQVALAATADCSGCHGNPPATPKHPLATDCKQCHVTSVDDANKPKVGGTHMDGKVQVAFSDLVNCGSCHGNPPQTTTHPKDALACGGCHATSIDDFKKPIAGGTHMDGNVQVALSASAPCGSCHGAPPATATHPKSDKCSQCHALSIDANQKPVVGGKHMDGTLQVALAANADCGACHGSPPQTAKHPKADQCSQCHATTVDAAKQLLAGGPHMDGKVQIALGANADCGSCHGNPPLLTASGEKHTTMTACAKCHGGTVNSSGKLVVGGQHLSGKVEVSYPNNCWSCHGTELSGGAPGPDLQGNTSPTSPKVGAHAAHVSGKLYSGGGIACLACHEGPEQVDSPGHFSGQLGITFPSSIAANKGKKPQYDAQTQSCSQVYCHSGALDTGNAMVPKWTQTQLACNACHAFPPPASTGHPAAPNCTSCHSKTLKPDGTLDVLGGFHINGSVP